MNLKEAFLSLDPDNDEDWTSSGAPRLDIVSEIVGETVSRAQLDEACPGMDRKSLDALTANRGVPPVVGGDASDSSGLPFSEDEIVIPDEITIPGEAPEEDPADAAHVEILDDVVGMPPSEVYSSIELVDRALTEFTRQNLILSQRRDAAIKKMNELGKRTVQLTNQRAKLVRAAGGENNGTAGIQDYLKAQAVSREERAARARRFLEAGTTAQDVMKELGGKSALDASMSRRRHSSRNG